MHEFCNLGCCLTFLISFSGAHLNISAAVLTDKVIVKWLVMLWVGHSTTHDDNHTQLVSHALHVLSMVIEELQEWYKILDKDNFSLFNKDTKVPLNHPRFFPFAYCYPMVGEDFSSAVQFEYLFPLQPDQSTCVTFLAKTKGESQKEVVVKFVQGTLLRCMVSSQMQAWHPAFYIMDAWIWRSILECGSWW
jgi:hypothetical protein